MQIVGVGASAGGLEAFRQFLANVPADSKMVFVLVQHMEPDKADMLVELLRPLCTLPVQTIVNDTPICAGHVYIVPPRSGLTFSDGRFFLSTLTATTAAHPIDLCFQSLAESQQDQAVGVILSGTATDGVEGMTALKEQGALTVAQNPATARHAELPLKVVQLGLADIVDKPSALPARIQGVFEQLAATRKNDLLRQDPHGELLSAILSVLHSQTGNDFSTYKTQTLYRRIERRMSILRQATLRDYVGWIQTHPEESSALFRELLICVTHFFRDPEVWAKVGEDVFPALLARQGAGENLRAWVAGCATGEEAYTLAIAFHETLARLGLHTPSLQIFATDLNSRAIDVARRGHYAASIAEQLPAGLFERYFVADKEGCRVIKKIRDMIIFAPHNLLIDPPFGKLDLLTCRNVLIYLTPDIHESLLERFHYSMNPGAFLLLGSSESIGGATHLFAPVAGDIPLYQWKHCLLPQRKFSMPARTGSYPFLSPSPLSADAKKNVSVTDFKGITERFLLGNMAPTAILTQENGDILHMSGKPERFLQISEGQPLFNIHALVKTSLKPALAEAYWDARQSNDSVRTLVNEDATTPGYCIEVTVSPLGEVGGQPGLMMVLLSEIPMTPAATLLSDEERTTRQNNRLLALEEMLRQTRAALQATREEMQTSREELTSTNEELQSTNEELTTSAEELRTMNEELVRARAESEQALARYTDLFDSAPVGYFIVDKNGTILQANRAAAALLDMEHERVAGSRILMHVIEADRAAFRQFLDVAHETNEEQHVEVDLWRETGEPRHVGFSAAVVEDDHLCRVVATDLTEARKAISVLSESEENYRLIFEKSYDALLIIEQSDNPRFLSGNHRARELFRLAEGQDFCSVSIADLSTEYQPDGHLSTEKASAMLAIAQAKGSHFFEWGHRRLDGSEFVSEVLLTAMIIRGQRVIQASMRDITRRKQAEDELELAAMVYRHSSEAMMVTDQDDRIIAVNRAFTRVTGYEDHEILGRHPRELLADPEDAELDNAIMQGLRGTGHWQGELKRRRKNGEVYTEWMSINTAWRSDGSVHRRVALFSDITEKKKSEELIWQQANFDSLTGLPNRRMFHERLAQEIKRATRDNASIALMFIDLDRFKEVNDTLGHDVGDQLLKDASERLYSLLREADFIGRLGGDEFAVILDESHEVSSINRVGQKILECLSRPYQLGNESIYISASIGISLFPDDGKKMEELLKNADQAMYAAKHLGRNRFSYFTPAMQEAAQRRMRMANDLRGALEAQQLSLHYQPIVNLRTGAIQKAEALLRWQHPVDGLISPADFIPVAEETGVIVEIGNWVFHEAVRQLGAWRKYKADFQVSINKSPVQFRDECNETLQHWVAHLRALDLKGDAITIEITEGLLMDAGLANLAQFHVFRDVGIQVALDDFGTGYSSLAYLKKFDIDYLKIDQSFTRNLSAGSDDMALCEAIIVMAHKLALKVIAEGIETEEQRQLLMAAGCDYGQGYLFSRPIPVQAFEQLLAADTCSGAG